MKADIQHFHNNFRIGWVKQNFSKCIISLHDNKNIIIKLADKGSAVVIMDRQQYVWEGYRQLKDKTYYTKLKNLFIRIIYLLWTILFNHYYCACTIANAIISLRLTMRYFIF